jgi:hypothetical protein
MSRPGRVLASLITVACMALPLSLHAAEAAHEAAAEELLQLIGIDTGIRPMARRMRETTVE